MESPLLNKSLEFATQIVLLYEEYSKIKKDTTIFCPYGLKRRILYCSKVNCSRNKF